MTAVTFHTGGDAPQKSVTLDDRSGRPHLAEVTPFALRRRLPAGNSFDFAIDLVDFRDAVTSGAYARHLLAGPPGLREPAEIVNDDGTRLGGLNFREAQVLCETAKGLLPTERQADLLLHSTEINPGDVRRAFWTTSWFDEFAYDRLYLTQAGQWKAAAGAAERPHRTIILWEQGIVRRFPCDPAQHTFGRELLEHNISIEALIVVAIP